MSYPSCLNFHYQQGMVNVWFAPLAFHRFFVSLVACGGRSDRYSDSMIPLSTENIIQTAFIVLISSIFRWQKLNEMT